MFGGAICSCSHLPMSTTHIMVYFHSPKEPPPPPPPESKWEEIESEVVHLTDDTFKNFLKKKKHCLIMFYAPCKF